MYREVGKIEKLESREVGNSISWKVSDKVGKNPSNLNLSNVSIFPTALSNLINILLNHAIKLLFSVKKTKFKTENIFLI